MYSGPADLPGMTKGGKCGCLAAALSAFALLMLVGLLTMGGDCIEGNVRCERNAQLFPAIGMLASTVVGAAIGLWVRYVVNQVESGSRPRLILILTLIILGAGLAIVLATLFF